MMSSCLRFRLLLSLICLALGGLTATSSLRAAEGRIGWHGEVLPPGLEKAEARGEYLWPKDSSVMVYVPAGVFPMGSNEGGSDERPVHEVELAGYYIDKYEVSWRQWKLSRLPYSESPVDRLRQPRGPDWGIIDEQPVLNVSWHDAVAYADWVGKRLPSEAEWEKAARGTDGRTFPWGDEPPTEERAMWRDHPLAAVSTAPVDCCAEGASPYGALNLAGNVYEWCLDVYEKDFYSRSPREQPVNRGEGRYRVLRGGAFVLEAEDLRSAYRYRLLPEDRTPYIGFRTVLPAAPAAETGGSR